jgi:hypothetical protein
VRLRPTLVCPCVPLQAYYFGQTWSRGAYSTLYAATEPSLTGKHWGFFCPDLANLVRCQCIQQVLACQHPNCCCVHQPPSVYSGSCLGHVVPVPGARRVQPRSARLADTGSHTTLVGAGSVVDCDLLVRYKHMVSHMLTVQCLGRSVETWLTCCMRSDWLAPVGGDHPHPSPSSGGGGHAQRASSP